MNAPPPSTLRTTSQLRDAGLIGTEPALDAVVERYAAAVPAALAADISAAGLDSALARQYLPSADELDYALDMPMKEEARKMIRMQMYINSTYFYYDSTKAPAFLNVVTCNTCHRGNPFPAYE